MKRDGEFPGGEPDHHIHRAPQRHQARGAGHPDMHHWTHQLILEGIRRRGMPTRRTDCTSFSTPG